MEYIENNINVVKIEKDKFINESVAFKLIA